MSDQGDDIFGGLVHNNNAAVSSVMGGVDHAAFSPDGLGHARKRNVAMAGLESSPGSVEEFEDSEMREEKRRQPVKRACNECRQQKVSRESVSRESQSVFALGGGGK